MKPRAEIAKLKQEARIASTALAMANARLAVQDLGIVHVVPGWTDGLPPQEVSVMQALIDAHPRVLSAYDVDDAINHRDRNEDRDVANMARTLIHRLRKRFGQDSILTVFNIGYQLAPTFLKSLQAKPELPTVHDMC